MTHAYTSVLELEGLTFDLNICSYSFHRTINESGSITSAVLGGSLFISLADLPTQEIFAWGMQPRLYKQGKIRVSTTRGDMPIAAEEVSFENATCTNLKIQYGERGIKYFTTLLTIQAESIRVGRNDYWVHKRWVQ